jgi:hypothetical protein
LGVTLKLHKARPEESVVTFRVEVSDGDVTVKTTVAPGTPAVPCVTSADIVAVEFFVRGSVGSESVIAIGWVGGFTVRFAVLSIDPVFPATTASTAYVAAGVPAGTDFVMVVDIDDPGETVSTFCPKDVGHVPGTSDDIVNDCEGHEDVSLLVTDTV